MLYIVLTCIRQKRADGQYQNTVKDLLLQNAISQKNEKPHTAALNDTAIPHIKIKIPQYRKPNVPPPQPGSTETNMEKKIELGVHRTSQHPPA